MMNCNSHKIIYFYIKAVASKWQRDFDETNEMWYGRNLSHGEIFDIQFNLIFLEC